MGDYDEVLSQIENPRQVLNKLVLEKGIFRVQAFFEEAKKGINLVDTR